jgi:hypothetical protein
MSMPVVNFVGVLRNLLFTVTYGGGSLGTAEYRGTKVRTGEQLLQIAQSRSGCKSKNARENAKYEISICVIV